MNLQEFLNKNSVEGLKKEVNLGERFKDESGEPLYFVIKAMSQRDYADLRQRVTTFNNDGRPTVNAAMLNMLCVIENTVTPNFKNMESLEALGCKTPEQYINKVLLPGEIDRLTGEIIALSGFGTGIKGLVGEVKN